MKIYTKTKTLILKVYKALVTTSRVNVGHTNSHEWEEYTFAAHSRKNGKIQIKLWCATEMIIIIIMTIMIIK